MDMRDRRREDKGSTPLRRIELCEPNQSRTDLPALLKSPERGTRDEVMLDDVRKFLGARIADPLGAEGFSQQNQQ
jgi:hypothetical protein